MLFLISSFMCDGIHTKYSRIMNNRFCKDFFHSDFIKKVAEGYDNSTD